MADHILIADEQGTVRKLALQGLRRAGADDPLFAPAPAADTLRSPSEGIGDLILVDVDLADAGPRSDRAPRARDGSNGSGAQGREAQ